MHVEMHWHHQDGVLLPVALWSPGPGYRMISSGVAGGGIGMREWVLNAQVPASYSRTDPAVHIAELAGGLGLAGEGVGLLTAASVADTIQRDDKGVRAAVTVGLRVPTWAAAPSGAADAELVPAPCRCVNAAYVNAVMTATEAKTQALLEAGFGATGKASDAICIATPESGEPEDFAGPRSLWGARIARAVHSAMHTGALRYRENASPA
jgi:adenosylcobinamide amidohydrolase